MQIPDKYLISVMDVLGMKRAILDSSSGGLMYMTELFKSAQCQSRDALEVALRDLSPKKEFKTIMNIYNESSFTSFSDTFVIALNISKILRDNPSIIVPCIEVFLARVKLAAYQLYSHGFPIRGRIEIGDVVIESNFIFGKPFVNALIKAECLDFTGVTVSDEVVELFSNISSPIMQTIKSCRLVVPLKDGSETNAYCMDWMDCHTNSQFRDNKFTQQLYDKFGMYSKTITRDVHRKIINTERIVHEIITQTSLQKDKVVIANADAYVDHLKAKEDAALRDSSTIGTTRRRKLQ